MTKVLGIDYGDKRVGLAIGAKGSLALPYKVIFNDGLEALLKEIRAIMEEEKIDTVVVGLPRSLAGQTNARWQITNNFVNFLKRHLSEINIETVDERMTSRLYERQGVRRDIDKHAAAAILDTYLQTHGR